MLEQAKVQASCGHFAWWRPRHDRWDPERLQKVTGRPCPSCRQEAHNQRVAAEAAARAADPRPPGKAKLKSHAVKMLPAGTSLSATLGSDGRWRGCATRDGLEVTAEGGGLMAVMQKLAVGIVKGVSRG